MSVLLLSKLRKTIELVISSTRALQPLCVSAALMQIWVFALLLGNSLMHFA